MIANRKEFFGGTGLMAGFIIILVMMFLPLLSGHNALEYLDALFGALANEVQDPDGVTGSEVRAVVPELLLLDFFDYVSHLGLQ